MNSGSKKTHSYFMTARKTKRSAASGFSRGISRRETIASPSLEYSGTIIRGKCIPRFSESPSSFRRGDRASLISRLIRCQLTHRVDGLGMIFSARVALDLADAVTINRLVVVRARASLKSQSIARASRQDQTFIRAGIKRGGHS